MIVAALALAGIFISTYLTLYKLGLIGELNCSIGSCETVNTSRWSIFLGLPVAAWGLLFYLDVFGVAVLGTLLGAALLLCIVNLIRRRGMP